MDDGTARAIAELEREYPAWQIWVVRRVYGGPVAGCIAEAQN